MGLSFKSTSKSKATATAAAAPELTSVKILGEKGKQLKQTSMSTGAMSADSPNDEVPTVTFAVIKPGAGICKTPQLQRKHWGDRQLVVAPVPVPVPVPAATIPRPRPRPGPGPGFAETDNIQKILNETKCRLPRPRNDNDANANWDNNNGAGAGGCDQVDSTVSKSMSTLTMAKCFKNDDDFAQLLTEYKILELHNSSLRMENDFMRQTMKRMEAKEKLNREATWDTNSCRTILIVFQMAICMSFIIIFVLLALHHLYLVES